MITNPSFEEITDILKQAKTIAIVGLSDNPERESYQIGKVLMERGYQVIPVNPKLEQFEGIRAYASLSDLPEAPDIVNVFRRSEFLPQIMEETLQIKAKVFWAQLGLEHQAAFDLAQQHGITSIMNQCIMVEYAKRFGNRKKTS